MRGHVTKPKGRNRWYVVVDVPDVDGKRRQKWHGSWATEKEAEHALPGIVGSLHDGSYVEPERVTVASFLIDEWLPAAKVTLRPSTAHLYTTLVGAYVVPRIGKKHLQKLSPADLNASTSTLLSCGYASRWRTSVPRPCSVSRRPRSRVGSWRTRRPP